MGNLRRVGKLIPDRPCFGRVVQALEGSMPQRSGLLKRLTASRALQLEEGTCMSAAIAHVARCKFDICAKVT